jgi:hypothetical protein
VSVWPEPPVGRTQARTAGLRTCLVVPQDTRGAHAPCRGFLALRPARICERDAAPDGSPRWCGSGQAHGEIATRTPLIDIKATKRKRLTTEKKTCLQPDEFGRLQTTRISGNVSDDLAGFQGDWTTIQEICGSVLITTLRGSCSREDSVATISGIYQKSYAKMYSHIIARLQAYPIIEEHHAPSSFPMFGSIDARSRLDRVDPTSALSDWGIAETTPAAAPRRALPFHPRVHLCRIGRQAPVRS